MAVLAAMVHVFGDPIGNAEPGTAAIWLYPAIAVTLAIGIGIFAGRSVR